LFVYGSSKSFEQNEFATFKQGTIAYVNGKCTLKPPLAPKKAYLIYPAAGAGSAAGWLRK
jgi:hypothetical protein